MPRFAGMIVKAMQERGYAMEIWTAQPIAYRTPCPASIRKWLGYIDQYFFFPLKACLKIRMEPKDTLFVFADQALGPWVPLVSNRPHVVHVHDFMALRSALGEFPENPTSWTGKIYQQFIRRGFSKGKCFISVSQKTRSDLHRFLPASPVISEVVYNGLNYPYFPITDEDCASAFAGSNIALPEGKFLLHIGGNQWYKNRTGVLEIYSSYTRQCPTPLPLVMIGPPPTPAMQKLADNLPSTAQVSFLSGLSNEQVCAAYTSAELLMFPSIAEGFGWPIAEAMACACPVLTTNLPPMNEVGGDAAFYIPVRPQSSEEISAWANQAAREVIKILSLSEDNLAKVREKCLRKSLHFDTSQTITAYENIYLRVLSSR